MKPNKTHTTLMDALNLINERAEEWANETQREKLDRQMAYEALSDFVDKYATDTNQAITVPLSENDIEELSTGHEFRWTFPTQGDLSVDVHLRAETEEDF